MSEPKDTSEVAASGADDPEFVTMDCSAVIADIWLLLDNECDATARARLQEHLDSCPSCLSHFGIERQLKTLINRKCGGERAPSDLRDRLRVEIRKSVIVHETTWSSGDERHG